MKTILVPTDFSADATNAAKYALHLARLSGAQIVLFNVYDVYVPVAPVQAIDYPYVDFQEISASSLKKQKELLNKTDPTIHVTYAQVPGIPSDEIIRYSKTLKPDLIVMGMKGHSALSRILFGSTTTATIVKGHTPVLSIPANIKYKIINKITFAYDLGTIGPGVKYWMKQLYSLFNAKVDTLSIISGLKTSENQQKAALSSLDKALENISHTVYFEEEHNIENQIEAFVKRQKAGLLMMEHRNHNFLYRFLFVSHTREVTFDIRVPLLSIPEGMKIPGDKEEIHMEAAHK